MLTRNRKISLLSLVALTAMAATVPEFVQSFRADELSPAASATAVPPSWDAVALGRVEPKSREVKVAATLPGRIADVLVKPNDDVFAGQLLVRLDDDEALARLAAADAQVALRKRARNDQSTPAASADRRKAEDAAYDSERAAADARAALDKVTIEWRSGSAPPAGLEAARTALSRAQSQLRDQQAALAKLRASNDTGLPTRLEGELNVARAEWTLAQTILEKTRIRAPFDGAVLQVDAKKGETAMLSPDPVLLVLGDLSGMRVRAEVDEQYLGRIRVGQRILVRTAAFNGRAFDGKVLSIARIVGPSRINARGPRKFNDVDVLEVVIDLANPGPLVVGEQVDVYFSSERPEGAETQ